DTSGKLVKNSGKISSYEEKVDLAGYPLGTYVVSIVTTKETITKKVIR
ncbi:MAG TPA: T9SS type A sorting domain-containing protein, partial [Kaistella sp.]|nr:T9SS type A sorting domain-containing protein [Kaistella sp.]